MAGGRHFLQIPGPTNVPDRILRAMDFPTIDHRGPDFAKIGLKVLDGLKSIFQTGSNVVIYPSSGTGAWEAALVNTLSPGDSVLMYETGHFASLWCNLAKKLNLSPTLIEGDWRSGVNSQEIENRLHEDKQNEIKAVCIVHNETSTGSLSDIHSVRQAMDNANHPALLMVDTISSLASVEYKHDEWGVDVTIAGSQKGLMLPPGLSFNAVSEKAISASKSASMARSYWNWDEMLTANERGYFPYTPATNLLYGLNEAIELLHEEGMENVFARHVRHGEATRTAVNSWGMELLCINSDHYSPVLTAVVMPEGHSADNFRAITLRKYDMSLGSGLSKIADRVFRIGHLGDFNDLMLCATLAGVEMGLNDAKVPHTAGGVQAAMKVLQS